MSLFPDCRKKLISLLLAAVMLMTAGFGAFAAEEPYSVRDAYMYFAQNEPEFILNILESGYGSGVTESLILRFMVSLQNNFYFTNRFTKVTESNFERLFIDAVKQITNASEYSALQYAIYQAYPEASDAIQKNRIHPSIAPLFENIKDMVLGHNMASRLEKDVDLTFRVLEVEQPEPITVKQLSPIKALPGSTYFRSESGLRIRLPLKWNDSVDTSFAGSSQVCSFVTLPSGYIPPENFNGKIVQNINVTPISAGGSVSSGVKWTLEDGVLTVSGTGSMSSYSSPDKAPWASVREAVNKIVIKSGITSVGRNAFAGINNLADNAVHLPDTVRTIGINAFAGCNLESILLPSGLRTISSGAFDCHGLTLYGGSANGAADKYAKANGAVFVPGNSELPQLISLDTEDIGGSRKLRIRSLNIEPGQAHLAVYGSGRELLKFEPITGEYMDIPQGAKYAEAFLWGEDMIPVCKSRRIRLSA